MKNMKTISRNSLASLLMAGLVVLAACNSGKSKKNNATQIEKQEVETKVREFVYPLPTSYEIVEMLNKIEAAYIFGLANDPTKAGTYFTERSLAINLGVFGGDLSYASTYNQKQETLDYIDASRKMLEGLNLSNAVDKDLPSRIENNQENKEVLVDLITNSFYDTYNYLLKNEREPVSAQVMAGAWVEGLYIATHISEETLNSLEMVSVVLKQKEPLDKLFEILNRFKDEADIVKTIEDLTPLAEIYASIASDAITQEQMRDIAKQVMIVRNNFVSAE
ncbi:hypothetical protein [Saccharicrinis aurantiacus]|uniref:hypothetical protein n=1 Tax=Saccharicrinis aurantiacus TaxID=1849719 RepID=UPI001FE74573|nr:hypothetical protein [Saccharicrinis aurantiacus]